MISPRSLAAFDGGKYFARNLMIISSHVSTDSIGKELNHNSALSLSEKGKRSKRTTLAEITLCFWVSPTRGNSLCVHLGRHWGALRTGIGFGSIVLHWSSIRSGLHLLAASLCMMPLQTLMWLQPFLLHHLWFRFFLFLQEAAIGSSIHWIRIYKLSTLRSSHEPIKKQFLKVKSLVSLFTGYVTSRLAGQPTPCAF